MIDGSALNPLLNTRHMGRVVLSAPEMASTNQTLLESYEAFPEGTLAICESQSAGRGRQRRLWHSPQGVNLYFSLLLKPQVTPIRLPQLAMLSAIALHRMLREVAPELPVALKWPNDLWINGRKLSGILCECPPANAAATPVIIVGIGLNVNSQLADFPPELQGTATSMAIAGGKEYSREKVLAAFLGNFEELYFQWLESIQDLQPFLQEWSQYDLLIQRRITLSTPSGELSGIVTGYTPTGLMLLQIDGENAPRTISSGDVHLTSVGKK